MPVVITHYFCVIASQLVVACAYTQTFSFNMHESNCVNLFVYQSSPVVNVMIVLQIPCSRDSEMGCLCRHAVKLQHACST